MNQQKELITPEIAERYLESNAGNRPLSSARLDAYVQMMLQKRWVENPHGVVFSANGRLIDGQHRLAAIVKSGVSCVMWVARDAIEGTERVIDMGCPRRIGQQLRYLYGWEKGKERAAICKLYMSLEEARRVRPNHFDINSVMLSDQGAFDWAIGIPKRPSMSRVFTKSAIIAPLAWLHRVHANDAKEFFAGVMTGVNLEFGAPALALRARIVAETSSGSAAPGLLELCTLAAFRAFVERRTLQKLYPAGGAYAEFRKDLGLPAADGKSWPMSTVRSRVERSRR
jgi:hypothetical protein